MQESPKNFKDYVVDFLNEPLAKGIGWPHTFGSVLLALIVVQAVTGILLSLYYSPNADAAYESVRFIEEQVTFGSLIRGLHHFAASAMVIVIFFHVARTFFYGAYKRPRQWTWIAGVVLLLVTLGFAFTGYLLPWDMKAYFATKVGINIGGMAPGLGEIVVKVLQGGSEMSTITLSRFYSLHVIVLPLLLFGVVGFHILQVRIHGETPPRLRNDEPAEYPSRFYPGQLFRDSLAATIVIAIVFLLAYSFGAPLEPKANPNDTSYVPRPDWYFYSLFQLLKFFPGKLEIIGAIILPTIFFAALFLLPFYDKNRERLLSKRPLARVLGSSVMAVILILTTWGAYDGKTSAPASDDIASVKKKGGDAIVADAAMGKQLYLELKCGKCHDQGSNGKNIPPGLEFAGNKYKQSWLVEYLQHPHRVRWENKDERPIARMPDFNLSKQEAFNLAAHLMSFEQPEKFAEPEFDWAETDSEMVLSGQELAFEYGCTGCHIIGDEGKNIGPALTAVGDKLIDSYIFNIIRAPKKIVPGTPMPNLKLEVEEIEDIVAYLRGARTD